LHGISGRDEGERRQDEPDPIRIEVDPPSRETSQSGLTSEA
jgi:hypothetical protein